MMKKKSATVKMIVVEDLLADNLGDYLVDGLDEQSRTRLATLLSNPQKYADHEDFHLRTAEKKFLNTDADMYQAEKSWNDFYSSRILAVEAKNDYETPVLTTQQERELFLAYNYCKFRALCVLARASKRRLSCREQREVLRWMSEGRRYQSKIVIYNLALLQHIGKRYNVFKHRDPEFIMNFAEDAMLRCVEGFNVGTGFKFSTYAWMGVKKGIFRGFELFARHAVVRAELDYNDGSERYGCEVSVDNGLHVEDMMARLEDPHLLSDTERKVLKARVFDGKTLEQIGADVGFTRERVRQIEMKAKEKLKESLMLASA